jgi:hypothetical protein
MNSYIGAMAIIPEVENLGICKGRLNRLGFLDGLFGYQPFDGKGAQNYRPKQLMGKGIVDIALGDFSGQLPKLIAPFELKGADTKDLDAPMPGRNKSPV